MHQQNHCNIISYVLHKFYSFLLSLYKTYQIVVQCTYIATGIYCVYIVAIYVITSHVGHTKQCKLFSSVQSLKH